MKRTSHLSELLVWSTLYELSLWMSAKFVKWSMMSHKRKQRSVRLTLKSESRHCSTQVLKPDWRCHRLLEVVVGIACRVSGIAVVASHMPHHLSLNSRTMVPEQVSSR